MKSARIFLFVWPALWATAIAALVALHFVHLRADFPNFSRWMDYAKYTDEGWYGNAAIRHALFGYWRMPGDFNPAVALPVWPVLLRLAFAAAGGVSLGVARGLGLGIFAANLLVSYALLCLSASRAVALAGVSFLAGSAFLWAFSRLALLEPLLIFFLLLSWLLAMLVGQPASAGADHSGVPQPGSTLVPRVESGSGVEGARQILWRRAARRTLLLLSIGLLLALAILTKTTAIFLLPATIYLLWHGNRFALRQTLADAGIVAAGALAPWAAYYLLAVHRLYAVDYHYLFAANTWSKPGTVRGWLWAFWYALHGTLWVDPILCGLVLAVLALGFLGQPRILRQPLVIASLLASAGYIFFTGWHNNPQPRYYEVVAYPLVFIACLGASALVRGASFGARALGAAAWMAFAVTLVLNVRGSLHFARHPEYSMVRAARGLTRYIDLHPNGKRLLLSISGDQISLITHLPAICDDFGTADLPYRLHQYQPGWYAAWNEIDPGTLEDLHTQYTLEQVARFRAFDDEDRDVLILYKLHPLPASRLKYSAREEEAANRPLE